MLKRAMLVAAAAAVAVPLLGGTAHASCLDDFIAGVDGSYTASPKSPYWTGLRYAQVSGTATVSFQGDALVSDATITATDQVRRADLIGDNALPATTTFVDCVAG